MATEIDRALEAFLGAVDRALGPEYLALLYGSAAREEHVSGRSDLNLLLILDALDLATLARLDPALVLLAGHTRTPPLLFTRDEWARSADVFPIEITDMRLAHRVLRGEDPLGGLRVKPGDLRRALERELRGKLLRLRQGYAVAARDPARLARLGAQTIATVAALFRCALHLAGRPVPRATPDALRGAGAVLACPPEPLLRYFALRGEPKPSGTAAEFEGYLSAVETAVRFIDQYHVGGN